MEIREGKNDPWLFSFEAFEIYQQCMYNASFPKYANEIMRYSENPHCRIFICAESGVNTGIIVLEHTANATAKIIGIAVQKELQKNGIGKFMVFSAVRRAKATHISAETDDDAVGFYAKIGFFIHPFVRHYNDGDIVRYRCELSAEP